MTVPYARPAPSDPDEITVEFGIDDIILTYNSQYWIAPHHDDGMQQWDVGMHFADDGPGPQFGRIGLHVVDHNRCLDPIEACDALSDHLFTISQALFEPGCLDTRQDLSDRLSCPGNTLIVDHVSIDKRLRGHGLGVFLTGLALEYFSTDTGVIALFPDPSSVILTPPMKRPAPAWGRPGPVWASPPTATAYGSSTLD